MDWKRGIQVVSRQRWLVAAGVMLTVILAVVIVPRVQPTYRAKASVILLGPSQGTSSTGVVEPTNPFLGFGDSLQTTGVVLSQILKSDATRAELRTDRASADYKIRIDQYDPVMRIVALSESKDAAVRTRDALLAKVSDELRERQTAAGAPANQQVEASVLSSSPASPDNGNRVRVAIAIVVLGLVAAFGLAFLVDATIPRRQSRRSQRRAEADEFETYDEVETDESVSNDGGASDRSPRFTEPKRSPERAPAPEEAVRVPALVGAPPPPKRAARPVDGGTPADHSSNGSDDGAPADHSSNGEGAEPDASQPGHNVPVKPSRRTPAASSRKPSRSRASRRRT